MRPTSITASSTRSRASASSSPERRSRSSPAPPRSALPRCGFGVESHGDAARNPLSHHLLVGGPETRDSFVHLNDKPGFGVEIDWDYAKRYAA